MSRAASPADRAPPAAQIRTAIRQMGRPHGKDVVAGLVTGLISIPEGMAYANIGGLAPPEAGRGPHIPWPSGRPKAVPSRT